MTKHNLTIDDMRECLENCHGVEEEYTIPATFAADGDPAKFEKVLAYFTDDRHSKFTDPTMQHSEDCQIPYLLLPEKFTLEIELGGSSMSTGENLALVLNGIAAKIGGEKLSDRVHKIQDRNGNSVGKWELK